MSETSQAREFEGLKERFLEQLTLRNLSPLSVQLNDLALRVFIAYAASEGVSDPGQVDTALFERYKAYLSTTCLSQKRGTPLRAATIKERLATVQRWFAWMKKTGVLFFNPTLDVQLPRAERRLPTGVLSAQEITKVLGQPDLRRLLGYRDRTIMEVLYATGARASELIRLRVGDVDLPKKILRVRSGKGGKERFAPLSTPCCRFLERYIGTIRPQLLEDIRPSGNNWKKKAGTGGDILFLSIYGGSLTRKWLGELFKTYFVKAGITRRVFPVHGFRHSVATHLIENGMDVRYVQVLLDHQSINTTQIYTHVERKTLHKLLDKLHPRSRAGETVQPFRQEDSHAVRA